MKLEVWGRENGTCPECNNLKLYMDHKFITYAFIDVDNNPVSRVENFVKRIPVIILRDDNGQEIKRVTGYNEGTRNAVKDIIKHSGQ